MRKDDDSKCLNVKNGSERLNVDDGSECLNVNDGSERHTMKEMVVPNA